jgi:hypothetical protein
VLEQKYREDQKTEQKKTLMWKQKSKKRKETGKAIVLLSTRGD